MSQLITTVGALALLSTSAFAETITFSGADHCAEDAIKHAAAVNILIQSKGTLEAFKTMATESVGAIEQGYFHFNPQFERSGSNARHFNCSIPLSDQMGAVSLSVYGKVNDLNQSNGGCMISRMRKVEDGGISKWFRYGTGKGFDWTSIQNSSASGEQFVSYNTEFNNDFEGDATLELKCRTTWLSGSVALGQITLTY
ncbi:hypothetical protein KO527_24755 [Pseudoalteromonas sp. C2R02]|uniref:hypothetical protein n=1 Tax=Pseudoalteromonas sp. C2R02 TaxID=2841565 RepID=UPI001C0A0635|nr:hypothetical protein [Pseudoalteromonas sp. C2R02]MBU2972549.1 hypothetical protein [Pseudoalteromonas sp. C2R02]